MSSLLEGASEDELLAKFTCNEESDIGFMIRNIPPAQPSRIRRESFRSSLGLLDTLPAELLFLTLDLLDFQSLSRLSRVSLKGKAVVENLATYIDMMKHAPTILTALGRTGLLCYHSATSLRRTLRSDKCVSCFGFGAFLFLPTCERVCFECLSENCSLRMMTISLARQCFHLTECQLKRIPIMYSIPGMYGVWGTVSRYRVYRLVSVKQAKRLAIEVHGSVENLPELEKSSTYAASKKFWLFKRFREAPLNPVGCDPSRPPQKLNLGEDDFSGVASIRFPSLSDLGVDHGRLCQGCRFIYNFWVHQRWLPPSVLSALVTPGQYPQRPLRAQSKLLRSTQGFLEHVKNCHGVRQLLTESGGRLDRHLSRLESTA